MKILLGIVFWTLAALEGLGLLFMLFVSLAAGPRLAENGDLATPLFWNVILPLVALIVAVLLFARTRSVVPRGIALLIVIAPIVWFFASPPGETIRTTFPVSPAPGEKP
jgi:hypothetical protein